MPIPLKIGDKVYVPTKVYKKRYEPARITDIDYKEYSVLIQPERAKADDCWWPVDTIVQTTETAIKREAEEEAIKEKAIKTLTKVNQLSIFDSI